MTTTSKAAQPSAVAKVVLVLEALSGCHGISEISRSTGLPTSTVHRILQELVGMGWVRIDAEHRYLPGVRLLSLAGQAATGSGITQIVRPILQRLCATTGHTVHFALRAGDEAVYVDKLEGDRAYAMRSRVGLSIPLHCTAIGKAILAGLPQEELREILTRIPLTVMTPRTITDPERLIAHLATVAKRGYAVDDEENEEHTRCLGAPVLDHTGAPLGGISVSALAFDLDRAKVRTCGPLLVAAAREASQALGLPAAASGAARKAVVGTPQ